MGLCVEAEEIFTISLIYWTLPRKISSGERILTLKTVLEKTVNDRVFTFLLFQTF